MTRSIATTALLVLLASVLLAGVPFTGPARGEGVAIEDPVGSREKPAAAKPRLNRSSTRCMRCHGMTTLAYRDLATGEFHDLSVDEKAYLASNHGPVHCINCHRKPNYDAYPHAKGGYSSNMLCTDCHEETESIEGYRYEFYDIEQEFYESVHFKALSHSFTCFSCHDPHTFGVARRMENTKDVIEQDNGFCLRCHANRQDFGVLSKRPFPELKRTHAWLPKAEQHWRKARCVECHTPHSERISHLIVGGKEAERDCVVCHRRDSIMLTKLYQHRVSEERDRAGFINSMVLTEAYVLGMTRNRILDNASIILIGVTLLGIGGHALARVIAGTRRRDDGD